MKLRGIIILSIVFILFSIFFFYNISPPNKFEFNENHPEVFDSGGYTKDVILKFDMTTYGELKWNEEANEYIYNNLNYSNVGVKNVRK